ncbi:protein TRACHEARY ELEMENT DIFFERENTIATION-RELATED 7A-like [Portunus trituberculatus]|uniref:protein TRACHEARY ELEMENT DIFFERENTIATION-RELATED 7A-like n=1 Tax=Portunus trituberculatus TaxID=210409 RepID=UPI001E1CCE54|nr:protein TRACHEARY ELEMENT DIFFERENTIATION-RELATED 7A-like [Portunus trituberculatus]
MSAGAQDGSPRHAHEPLMSRHSTTAITTLNKTSGVTPCRGCERGGRRGAQAGRGVCWRGGRVRDQLATPAAPTLPYPAHPCRALITQCALQEESRPRRRHIPLQRHVFQPPRPKMLVSPARLTFLRQVNRASPRPSVPIPSLHHISLIPPSTSPCLHNHRLSPHPLTEPPPGGTTHAPPISSPTNAVTPPAALHSNPRAYPPVLHTCLTTSPPPPHLLKTPRHPSTPPHLYQPYHTCTNIFQFAPLCSTLHTVVLSPPIPAHSRPRPAHMRTVTQQR